MKLSPLIIGLLLCSSVYANPEIKELQKNVAALQNQVDDAEFLPATTEDALVSALQNNWPQVPGIAREILEEIKILGKTATKTSLQIESLFENKIRVDSVLSEHEKANIRQDIKIELNEQDIEKNLNDIKKIREIDGQKQLTRQVKITAFLISTIALLGGLLVFLGKLIFVKFTQKKEKKKQKEENTAI